MSLKRINNYNFLLTAPSSVYGINETFDVEFKTEGLYIDENLIDWDEILKIHSELLRKQQSIIEDE